MRAALTIVVPLSCLVVGESAGQTGGTFVRTGDMTMPRSGHIATLLQSGKVLITGGTDAVAGEVIELRCTGPSDGSVIPPRVAIGGHFAELLSVAAVDPTGARALQVRMPAGIAPGTISLRLSYLGRWSNELTIAAR